MDFLSFLGLIRDVLFNDRPLPPKTFDRASEALVRAAQPPPPPVTAGWFFPALGGYAFGQATWLGHVANQERHARRVQQRLAHLRWEASQHPAGSPDGRGHIHPSAHRPPPPHAPNFPPPRQVPVLPHTPPTTSGWWIPATAAVTKAAEAAWAVAVAPTTLWGLGGLGASLGLNYGRDWMDKNRVAAFGAPRTSGSSDIVGSPDIVGLSGASDIIGMSDIVGFGSPLDLASNSDIVGRERQRIGEWWHEFWRQHVDSWHAHRHATRISQLLARGDARAHRAIALLNRQIVTEGNAVAQETVDTLRHIFRRKVQG